MVTFVEGITKAAGPRIRIEYDQGCNYTDTVHFGGTWAASNCDVTIAVIGLTPVMEGEDGDAFLAPHGGDKTDLDLPTAHIAYIKALRKAIGNKPLIAVITAGSAVDISPSNPMWMPSYWPGIPENRVVTPWPISCLEKSRHLAIYPSLFTVP